MQEREAKVWGKMKGFFGKLPTDVRRIVGLEGGSKGGLEVGRPEKKGGVASVEGTEGRRPDGKESLLVGVLVAFLLKDVPASGYIQHWQGGNGRHAGKGKGVHGCCCPALQYD